MYIKGLGTSGCSLFVASGGFGLRTFGEVTSWLLYSYKKSRVLASSFSPVLLEFLEIGPPVHRPPPFPTKFRRRR